MRYRFGFNGMEADNEIKGTGNSYTTEFRGFDPRLGRWLSTDPVIQPHLSPYQSMGGNPIAMVDPAGAQEDFFEDDKGNVAWDNSRSSSIQKDGKTWKNIGSKLTIEMNSYIDDKNDIPVPGVQGDKLTTTLTIQGNYDKNGKFSGFKSSTSSYVGYTFGLVKGEKSFGSINEISLSEDGSWSGGFNLHTKVDWKEAIGMGGAFGNIVDVNQTISYNIGANGLFTAKIGHGTFPSVTLDIFNTSKIEYKFLEHSFMLSHGVGLMSNAYETMGLVRQKESYYSNQKYMNQNSSFIKFTGYTAGSSGLSSYPHLPKR